MGLMDTIRSWFRTKPATEGDLEREDYEGVKEDAFVSQSYAGSQAERIVEDEFKDE
ncbi:MAG TPA: hypothetical protein VFB25_10160 [Gaiellaceae bacterium]|nr:hypothetical protein [Gaiellaceae bacterium]